jgi:hypothetical protein
MSAVLLETALDERATLEAAFALIDADDWSLDADGGGDTSDTASSSSSSSSSSPYDAVAARVADAMDKSGAAPDKAATVALPLVQKMAPARPKRSGNRNKEALASLRAEVRALQTRADTLKRQNAASSRLADSSTTELVAVATNPMAFRIAAGSRRARREVLSPLADLRLTNVWKDVAERQRLHRATSEMENTRLRTLIAGHQRTVKSLKGVLQRQAALQVHQVPVRIAQILSCVTLTIRLCCVKARTNVPPPRTSAGNVVRSNFSPAEVATLRDLWESLEHYYLGTDYAFQLSGLAAAGYSSITSTQITPLSATTVLIEVTGSALLPLGFRETGAILWKFIMNSFSDEDREQHQVSLPPISRQQRP